MQYDIFLIGTLLVILVLTLLAAYLVNRFFNRLIRRSAEGMGDTTSYHFLRYASVAVVYLIGFGIAIYSIPSLRTLASSLLAGAGLLTVAIGFASQQALSNIIGGIFIVVFRPFKINDRLRVKEHVGFVEDITLRHTVIRDFENKRIIIPNSVISNDVVVNSDYKDVKICKFVDFSISYESNIGVAKQIMQEEALKHPLRIDTRTEEQIANGAPEVPVRVIALGDFSVTIRANVWGKDSADAFVMGCDLLESIKARFEEAGVEIPYPHRTLVYKNGAPN